MLIFSRYNLVLLAVPKTGSTALEVALGQEADGRFGNPPELKHLPLQSLCAATLAANHRKGSRNLCVHPRAD